MIPNGIFIAVGKMTNFSRKIMQDQLTIHRGKNAIWPLCHTSQKKKFCIGWTEDLNVKIKNKTMKSNRLIVYSWLLGREIFHKHDTKNTDNKRKFEKLYYIKIKNFYSSKHTQV